MTTSSTPLAYLHTAGPAADPITRLGWGLAAVSIIVVVVVTLLLIGAIFRRRPGSQPDENGGLAHAALMPSRQREGLRWIFIGTGISAVVLFGCAVWTLTTLAAVAAPSSTSRVTIEVRGFQYWWRVRYLDASGAVLLTTANEIHIPVGEAIRFQLTSGDVIHSFWVPSLGGKMDAVPGQTNVTWLQADQVGRYRGQCSEYCGAQHAHMALFVDAESPDAFAQWVAQQRSEAAPRDDGTSGGKHAFEQKCAGCHAVRGSEAAGALAPDLTHLMSRQTIGAGVLPNNEAMLRQWIGHTQDVKPGSEMPTMTLQATELDAIVGYLRGLR